MNELLFLPFILFLQLTHQRNLVLHDLIFSENPAKRDNTGKEKEDKKGKQKLWELQLPGTFCSIRNQYYRDAFESQNKPPMGLAR
jgi:hypothetical protein